ncbi:unnamed protein product [Linum tenue]|uniref:Maturase K n=1 Tax=Linum tenue TaxID=586396 RepID=A0AAV0HFI8_9ROSI|nr:unnamed protein product [Linum tenue]
MHEDNQFGRCGRTLLWISDHILHGAFLSLPSPSSGYRRRRRRNREEDILLNFFWNNHKHFFDYGSTTGNSIRKLSIQCVFLNNFIFQLFNHFLLPSSMLIRKQYSIF